jgi:hypothetical protein
MIAFEVQINDEKVCTAGLGDFGVLTAVLSWVGSRASEQSPGGEALTLHVGGLTDSQKGVDQFVDWVKNFLAVGDEVKIKIIETSEADEPSQRYQREAAEHLQGAREYYEQLKAESENK